MAWYQHLGNAKALDVLALVTVVVYVCVIM